jgi:hypothetical protein
VTVTDADSESQVGELLEKFFTLPLHGQPVHNPQLRLPRSR